MTKNPLLITILSCLGVTSVLMLMFSKLGDTNMIIGSFTVAGIGSVLSTFLYRFVNNDRLTLKQGIISGILYGAAASIPFDIFFGQGTVKGEFFANLFAFLLSLPFYAAIFGVIGFFGGLIGGLINRTDKDGSSSGGFFD